MKLAILSDFHLGYERFAEDAFEQAQAAVLLASEKADALLLPGDLFDSRIPKPETISQAFSIFRGLAGKEWGARVTEFKARDGRGCVCAAPIIAIHGTHEMRPKGLTNPIALLEAGGFLINAQSATVIIEKGEEKVAISGLGGVPERHAKDALEALAPQPVPGALNIFMFHQSISDFIPARGELLGTEDLPRGFDLYVCGHVHHSAQATCMGKPLIIPGSTVVTQLKEDEAAEKGFIIFDTKTGGSEFVGIGSRPFIFRELEFDSASPEEVERAARAEIEKILSQGFQKPPIIRLRLKGSMRKGFSASDASIARIPDSYSPRAFVSIDKSLGSGELKDRVERLRSPREGGSSVRELGLELLREKMKSAGLPRGWDAAYLLELFSKGKKEAAQEALVELLREQASS